MPFDGITIDYEALPGRYRTKFGAFIKELSEALHAENKLLGVAIHPKPAEDSPAWANGTHAQDWEVLQQYADQLHLMSYGQHSESSGPGPVTSTRWLEPILAHAVLNKKIPSAKLFVGLSLYGEEWQRLDSGEYRGMGDMTFSDVQKRRRKHKGVEVWAWEHDSPSILYKDERGNERVIWFENRQSSERKLALAARYGLCNLLLWRMGGEVPGIWKSIHDRKPTGISVTAPPPEYKPESKDMPPARLRSSRAVCRCPFAGGLVDALSGAT